MRSIYSAPPRPFGRASLLGNDDVEPHVVDLSRVQSVEIIVSLGPHEESRAHAATRRLRLCVPLGTGRTQPIHGGDGRDVGAGDPGDDHAVEPDRRPVNRGNPPVSVRSALVAACPPCTGSRGIADHPGIGPRCPGGAIRPRWSLWAGRLRDLPRDLLAYRLLDAA